MIAGNICPRLLLRSANRRLSYAGLTAVPCQCLAYILYALKHAVPVAHPVRTSALGYQTAPEAHEQLHQVSDTMPPDRTIKQDTTDDSTRPLAQSCVQCRTRKIKCNSAKPQCSNCQAIKSDCEYRSGLSGEHRGTTGAFFADTGGLDIRRIRQKPGLRAGVGSELLQRVS